MASTNHAVARTLHDVGLAAWFGGSLMGAAGVNGAAAVVEDPTQRLRVANAGWARWTPLNLAAIAAHLAGGAVLMGASKGRLVGQQGVATASMGQDRADSRRARHDRLRPPAGQEAGAGQRRPGRGRHHPSRTTPDEVARAQRQLTALQWVIPALTGAMLVVSARLGEQQRPTHLARGMIRRLLPGR